MSLSVASASTPRRPSTNATEGVKCLWLFKQALRYFRFLPARRSPVTSLGSWTGRRRRQYSQHAFREFCPYHESKDPRSAGSPSLPYPPAAMTPCPLLLPFPWPWSSTSARSDL